MAIGTELWIAQSYGTVKNGNVEFDNSVGIFDGINDSSSGTQSFNQNSHYGIYQLGIQTLPGIKIKLGSNSSNSVRVGQTGIFELNLNERLPLDTPIIFENLDILTRNSGDNNNYCLIDVIYYKRVEGAE